MTELSSYDQATLYHWLWFRLLCHECTPTEFQRIFENIIKRVNPDFISIRPYGQIGDRKCDGLFFANGTVFQVYSPDELTQKKLIAKISEDLDGAVAHWGTKLEKWVFVYNVRRGLPPDVPEILAEKKKRYPEIKIGHISSDGLWEMARGLSVQQRAEVLGPPPGQERFFGVEPTDQDKGSDKAERSWCVIIQDVSTPISFQAVKEALKPDVPFGVPFLVNFAIGPLPWGDQAELQRQLVDQAVERARDVIARFAVFSFAPIPLAIHLGFVLSDRLEVQCFQFDRDHQSWRWPEEQSAADCSLGVRGVPEGTLSEETDVVIRVSLSARVIQAETRAVVPDAKVEVDLSCQHPDVSWLRSPIQLRDLGSTFRGVLAQIRGRVPRCRHVHLFYAGPTGGAVVIGQQINPRMNPPVMLYEYCRNSTPRHRRALVLNNVRIDKRSV